MNFIFSKVSDMPPEGDAAGAALGARGVACFLLFLEEASLLFVLRFLPMANVAAASCSKCALKMKPRLADRGWRRLVAAVFAQLHCFYETIPAPVVPCYKAMPLLLQLC